MADKPIEMTKRLAEFIVRMPVSAIPKTVFDHAKVALMDWIGVTLAGKNDPLVAKLLNYAELMGGREQCVIIGHGVRKSICQAALINGSAGHALDYDDSMIAFLGHPSVTLFPGILALAEWKKSPGEDLLTAYVIGLRAGVAIATCAGVEHYLSGYHGTSTMGALASASACSRLLGLTEIQATHALGIAGTQAGGLKRVFGTMCKPFHAGHAAEVGVTAALLAADGFTSAEDILEGPGGFFQAMKGSVNAEAINSLGQTWVIENLAQKYHASCHATHSPIEASLSIVKKEKISLENIRSIQVNVSETALSAAFRNEAHTGLEGKFSIPYCVANALLRGNTGLQAFTDEKVNDTAVKQLMAKISTRQDPEIKALDAGVHLQTVDGRKFDAYSDIFKEIPELGVKQEKIKAKSADLCEPVIGKEKTVELIRIIESLEKTDDLKSLFDLLLS
jgi:2-methylcitrate dehydratase PrpD